MSTLNCEKENLLGQTVLVKRPLSNFEKGTIFFVHPLYLLGQGVLCEDVIILKGTIIRVDKSCSGHKQ